MREKKCISTDFRLLLSVINLSASFKAWFKTFGSYIYINILTKLLPLPAYYNIFFFTNEQLCDFPLTKPSNSISIKCTVVYVHI